MSFEGELLDCNRACATLLGYDSPEELIAAGLQFQNDSDRTMIVAALEDLGSLTNLEVGLRRRDGGLAWVYQSLIVVDSERGRAIEGTLVDVTEQRLATETFEFQTQHDPLTGLPNRSLFLDRLAVQLARARRQDRPLAVMFLDLDHFELLNVTFGRGIADRVLRSLAERLREAVRTEDSVARYGSDEFVCLLYDFGDEENSIGIVQRIMNHVSQPFTIDGNEICVNASVGVSLFPDDGTEAETLIQRAAEAMYRSKELGRNTCQLYEVSKNDRAYERAFLIASLERALEEDQFELHYQPQIDIDTGGVECVEALLRWNHPVLGLIQPPSFMPVADQLQLGVGIGSWVFEEALRQSEEWRGESLRVPRVGVNLSSRQMLDIDLIGEIRRMLEVSNVLPQKLEIEISESICNDSDLLERKTASLSDLGVSLALDDWGTGRFALGDLRKLKLNTIKIDRSFVANMLESEPDAALVGGMLTMGRGLGFRVVAEGVETKDQFTFLADRHCTTMQGNYLGRPMRAEGLRDLLKMQH
ncbi:MAG: EAL domain-containing protein, partial [Thermoanaerobaculia bacterium]|nr:EAL domain-containing protein [Thermoanaerobaculia bacterium]